MKPPRRLLILEDDLLYAELLDNVLHKEWPACETVVVTNRKDFNAALEKDTYDLILSDYVLPAFDGLQALALARELNPEIPFVIVSGTVGDEVAAESLKRGATDYVLKDRIARLVPAIRRALNEVEESNRRKLAETAHRESEALKVAIMDAALDCIVVLDHKGKIIEFNPAAEKTFGYLRGQVISQFFDEKIVPSRLREQYREDIWRSFAREGESLFNKQMETTAMRADGSEFPVEMAIVPIHFKDRNVLTIYLRDITERKEAEEKVRMIQAMLKKSNKDLIRKNREIQSFYHTLSHELKTPLTSAREFVSIVLDGLSGPINQTQIEYLTIAKESCDQLRLCVNDLLDTTRLETGKLALELKPALLTQLLQRTVTALNLKAGEKGISLISEVQENLPEITMDEHRITQVVTNLLNNAINYTLANGKIIVRANEVMGQPEWLQVSISDTGRGIPVEECERIFDRLYQVKTGDATSEHGIGLGLYLCRELVQLHGGNIWVESQPDKGSTFFFVLPKNQELLRFNVLVMDDDPQVLKLSRDILNIEYNVRTACNGDEGLKEMHRQLPNVVLLDLEMPRLDGPGTLKEIRKHWGSSVPIIVYTAYSDSDLMRRAMEHSPFTVLAKPCLPDQVVETVHKVLRSNDTILWNRHRRSLYQAAGPLRNGA